jgi:plastocyanin
MHVSTTQVDLPRSYLFAPKAIVISAGSTVTWTDDDQFTHGVELVTPHHQRLGDLKPGAKLSYNFAAPGTWHYRCPYHPHDMQGDVTVR